MDVAGVGFAPPSPHDSTAGMSTLSRCTQCHVFATTKDVFATNNFRGVQQDMRRGSRLYPHAPPVMPHAVFMRENCTSCHAGLAAREEIRCTHPDRVRCQQCHVSAVAVDEFAQPLSRRTNPSAGP
jgi:cytochrome c-type protein NapB